MFYCFHMSRMVMFLSAGGCLRKTGGRPGSYGVTEVQTELILCDTFKACGRNIMTSPQMKVMTSTGLF